MFKLYLIILIVISTGCRKESKPANIEHTETISHKPGMRKKEKLRVTIQQRNYDKKNLKKHKALFSKINSNFNTLKIDILKTCSEKPETIKFEKIWKKKGDFLMSQLISLDPLGRQSGIYSNYYDIIRKLTYSLPGSRFLACSGKEEYNVQLTVIKYKIKRIESYLKDLRRN